MEKPKSEAMEIFGHIKEECVKDPLYMTKLLVSVFGSNIVSIVIRIAIYIAVYWGMTHYFGITNGVASLIVLAVIITYNSFGIILNKIKDGAKNGKQSP
jgi:hypothetical protein